MTTASGSSNVEASQLCQMPVGGSSVLAIFKSEHQLFRRELSQRICTTKCWGRIQMPYIARALGKVSLQPSPRCHETVSYGVETCLLSLCLGYEAVERTHDERVCGAEAGERSSSARGDICPSVSLASQMSHSAVNALCRAIKLQCELYSSRQIAICLDPYCGLGFALWCLCR